jgi:hypothetical protein
LPDYLAADRPYIAQGETMDLMDLLSAAGADESVGKLAGSVGIGTSDAQNMIGALAPALMRSLQKQAESSGGLEALQGALASGNHQRYVNEPDLMGSDDTRDDGNKILGHLFGSKDVSRNVAAQAAADTGIDADLIKKALPLVAGLAMGALSKESSSGAGDSGDLLGNLVGDMLGGGGIDDLLGMAKKLF